VTAEEAAVRESSETTDSADVEITRVRALDGLRAVAILSVLLFHHFQHRSRAWSGGFLGVDLFFVLSGFLITTLLLREHGQSEKINFGHFWSRRARRLLPALFVLIVGDVILVRLLFDPPVVTRLQSDGIATLLYFENWNHLTAAASSLDHAWSLSVEEQWYLIWPLLLAVLLVVLRRRLSLLACAVAGLAVVSAIECALLFHGTGDRAYYGTDTRAQELLVGAGLAVLIRARPHGRSRLLSIAGWAAAAFLAWMIFTAQSTAPWMYRGGFLAVAVAAAIVIAAVMQSETTPLARVLSARPLVAIGLISYGLYLFHEPIYIWLNPARTHLALLPLLFVRLTVLVAVATLSYFFVEMPFRRGKHLDQRHVVILVIAGLCAVCALLVPAPSAHHHRAAGATPVETRRPGRKDEAAAAP
jgi:peptidoglycan/LPS O-acetylase OafA/YrhL